MILPVGTSDAECIFLNVAAEKGFDCNKGPSRAETGLSLLQVTGIYKGDWSQVYGISFLVFNTDDKIQEVLTLMQPFPAQRRGLLKREE